MEMERNNPSDDDNESDTEMREFDEDVLFQQLSEPDNNDEEEIFGLPESDEFEPDEHERAANGTTMESDASEENGREPDERAWGRNNQLYYSTDYVDRDSEGFYEGKEAENAELEEKEAENIQSRLASQLSESDYIYALKVSATQDVDFEKFENIGRDTTSLTALEKLDLMEKESPEFSILVQDLKTKCHEIDSYLIPILNYFDAKKQSPPYLILLRKKFSVFTNYCANIVFYLLRRTRRGNVDYRTILKSLCVYRRIVARIQDIHNARKDKVDKLLLDINDSTDPMLDKIIREAKRNHNILDLIKKSKEEKNEKNVAPDAAADVAGTSAGDSEVKMSEEEEKANGENEESINDMVEDGKRAITYQMAKNKGLMPKRNKLQRNPRVKHRKKYKKALIRRRGQVRFARKEVPVYGGEPSGIKANVTKSIKFK